MKFISNCNQVRCAFREKCQRFNPEGSDTPILMFLPDDVAGNTEDELNGCVDFWPKGSGVEWFEKRFTKTPVNS